MGLTFIMDKLGERKAANFTRLAGEAGDLDVLGKPYPRMQILLSDPEILAGKRFQTPTPLGRATSAQPDLGL